MSQAPPSIREPSHDVGRLPRSTWSNAAAAPTLRGVRHHRASLIAAAVLVIVVGVPIAAGSVTVSHTTTVGDLLVGLGTLALAWFTFGLGAAARSEGSQVAAQVKLERERLDTEAQPWVTPAPDPAWAWASGSSHYSNNAWMSMFPVKNIGAGAALNITGRLQWGPPSGLFVDMLPTSLGAGEEEDLRVDWKAPAPEDFEWRRVEGTLDYSDTIGRNWRTTFVIENRDNARYVQVRNVLQRPGSSRPKSEPPESWPASPSLP